MKDDPTAVSAIKILLAAGLCGSLVRVLLDPKHPWTWWVVQVVVGTLAAVFLGGALARAAEHLLGHDEAEWRVYAAAGFLVGTAAEKAIAAVQRRLLDPPAAAKAD